MTHDVVDLFAGSGWSVACRWLDLSEIGIELDTDACDTRDAAGFDTIRGSVCDYGPATVPARALIASPPCQLFSTAGTGAARKLMPEILSAVAAMGRGEQPDTDGWPIGALLVLEPLRWIIEAINLGTPYEWIALEQVPPVLPIWEAYADVLRCGYGVDTGNLSSECFGVAQTRKRAIFVARLGKPAKLPAPTHSRYYPRDPKRLDAGVLPWVSMAEALGWGMNGRPSMTVCAGGTARVGAELFGSGARKGMIRERDSDRWVQRAFMPAGRSCPATPRNADEPATTLTGAGNAVWVDPDQYEGVRAGMSSGQRRAAIDAAGQRERPPSEPSATITGKGTAYWQIEPLCADCGCSDLVHDEGGFCAGPCGGACGGRNVVAYRTNSAVRDDDKPAPTILGNGERGAHAAWVRERPATTVNGDPRISRPGRHDPAESGSQQRDAIRVSVTEAAILQSFPPDFPWTGTRTAQYRMIGNAVPCLLARAVVAELIC